MNDVCKRCGHHWLSHVIYGPNGHGCQELVGESEPSSCNCETFIPTIRNSIIYGSLVNKET